MFSTSVFIHFNTCQDFSQMLYFEAIKQNPKGFDGERQTQSGSSQRAMDGASIAGIVV